MRGEEIGDFIAESRQTVELLDRVILRELEKHGEGLTLRELVDTAANAVGDWPRDSWDLARFPVKGHMDHLESRGAVRKLNSHPIRWERA